MSPCYGDAKKATGSTHTSLLPLSITHTNTPSLSLVDHTLLVHPQVMACPGGCIGGGGQPKTKGPDVLQRRMQAVYSIDNHMKLRKSHENPEVKASAVVPWK